MCLPLTLHSSLNDFMQARLMHVADILSISPKSAAYSSTSDDTAVEKSLVSSYISTLSETSEDIQLPELLEVSAPSLLLLQRESAAHSTPNDEYFIVDDPKVSKNYRK